MEIKLPIHGKAAIVFPHFPTKHQAFIFRAYEYVLPEKIAAILGTTAEKVRQAAADMGILKECESDIWLQKGYITIIRRMWHILPYEQLLSLLDMDEETFAVLLREEDFLYVKLSDKPICEPVTWRELSETERIQTGRIRKIMQTIDLEGEPPFAFSYDVEEVKFSGKPVFDVRMLYGFSCLYQNALEVDSRSYCPDEALEAYQKTGINALWIPAILYKLVEFPFDKELSKGYPDRINHLRKLVNRCKKYGIKIFLYLNEPRSMPETFFERHPKIKGHKAREDSVCLCTSTKEVQDYITDGVENVCRQVPDIGGFFAITRHENRTNCYSHTTRENCNCVRCSQRNESEVIAEVIACMEKGAHKVNPDIKVIAWSWAWDDFNLDIIKALPENVILQSQSELHVPRTIGDVDTYVRDYSMSIIGPGERAKAEWKAARERGLETSAKIQVNTTWECSTVPAVPVYQLIEEHIQKVRNEGVSNLMLGWTLGGYPSQNIMHAAKYFYEKCDVDTTFGSETAAKQAATRLFSEAFQEFPFNLTVLYRGPQNGGIGNLLFLEPTGYESTMTCYAYDDVENWRGIFPLEVFENQFSKLCSKWEEGLKLLEQDESELYIMSNAAYCQFKASLNQIRFYRARSIDDKQTMKKAAEEEIVCARKMLTLMNLNPAIGFEAANHYYYSKGCLCEKIINCNDIIYQIEQGNK